MHFMLRSAKERRVYPGLGLQIGRTWARALGTGIRWLERQLACWGVAGGGGGVSPLVGPNIGAPDCYNMLPPIGSALSAPESVEIPLFTPLNGVNVGLPASVAASAVATGFTMIRQLPAGEFNCSPSTGLPARLSCQIVDLEFVEMSELLPDSWQENTQQLVVFDTQFNPCSLSRKAPVQDISLWIECFSRMAAVLVTRYPDKGTGTLGLPGVHLPGGAQLRGRSLGGLRQAVPPGSSR